MSYRLRYQWSIDWVGDGLGPLGAASVPLGVGGGGAQTLAFFQGSNVQIVGSGTSPAAGALVSSNITTLVNAVATDMNTQLGTATNLGRLQNFVQGGQ